MWEDLNCVACHRFSPPLEKDPYDRVSLHFTAEKYTPQGLMQFLSYRGPPPLDSRHRFGQIELSTEEAEALHLYLRKFSIGKLEKLPELRKADVKRGLKVFYERDCIHCHQTSPFVQLGSGYFDATHNKPLRLDRGCLAEGVEMRGTAPNVPLSTDQKKLLALYFKTTERIVPPNSPVEESQRLMRELRCNACHNRDGITAQRMAILAEESESGLTPEALPELTWAGEKFQPKALLSIFEGKDTRIPEQPKPRPWLKSRMPGFVEHAKILATGLAAEHGLGMQELEIKSEPALAEIGEQLTHKEHLDCRQCHAIGDLEPMGDEKTKLAPGINFVLVGQRLRPDYYARFVLDPPRWEVSTRMPKLAPDGRSTKVTQFYEGDAEKQIEALWNYLLTVKR